MLSSLPSQPPLRCRWHIHAWGDWYRAPLHHMGEMPWDRWQHICTGLVRNCQLCGKSRRHSWRGACDGNVTIVLSPQPYSPSESELGSAYKYLMNQMLELSSR